MVSKQAINFHYLVPPFHFSGRTALKTFIIGLFKREGYKVDTINFIFCSDAYMLEVNRTYLDHDYYTDIITFPISEPGTPISSDIYISVDRVRDNAITFGTSFRSELHRVIFHGALHLCGYKDKSARDVSVMRAKEEEYLKRYFVPRGTAGRK